MRIEEILDFHNTTARLENGQLVDISHQSFCTIEMFGPGHDEECECLDYDGQGGAGEISDDEYADRRRKWEAGKKELLRRIQRTFEPGFKPAYLRKRETR